MRPLCHALAAAHDIQIVHRDLKPENVFLARSRLASARWLVKVLDFGIAKILTGNLTATGSLGTPLWMAPEQTEALGQVAPSTDVWALGLLAFRMLTGCVYWRAANDPTGQSAATLFREILIDPLPSASERARALDGRPPPAGFDEWFARCVVREKERRFASAREA